MVDYCTTKQLFTFILALIGVSILVFFIEEYAEENAMERENQMKIEIYDKHTNIESTKNLKTSSDYPVQDCWKHEKTSIISKCIPCQEFEIKAIKAEQCLPTGFYDRVNCTKSNVVVLRPCFSNKESKRRQLYIFMIINVFIMAVSYFAATQRKETLEQYTYMRVSQNF